jgi:PAS domain S-box-containing protein
MMIYATGCSREPDKINIELFKTYRDIPGITEQEISGIEALQNKYKTFSYVMSLTTEAFLKENGEPGGYAALLCEWLTSLFDIRFQLEIYEPGELVPKLRAGNFDFAGNVSTTEERMRMYYMTDPIMERQYKRMRLAGSRSLHQISMERPLRYAFLEGLTTADTVALIMESGTYETLWVKNFAEAYAALENGDVDAFVGTSAIEAGFVAYGNIYSEDFFPLFFAPVSMATARTELQPIILVVNKALQNGAMPYLAHLYRQGYRDYMRYKMSMLLSNEEREYISSHPVIPVVANYNNYPVCFYNTREEEWQGIFFDLMDEVSLLTGLSFNLIHEKNAEWPVIYEMLKNGEAALSASLLWTKEREEFFIWPRTSLPPDYYALLSRSDYPDIAINEIPNTKIGVGGDTAVMFRQWFPTHKNIVEYASMNEAIDALQRGEVDMALATERRLLLLTHYLELPGYKANIVFDQPVETLFGFNKNEAILCSIIDKALRIINTNVISDQWMRRTYDYRAKVAEARLPWLIGATALSVIALAVLVMFLSGRGEGKRLAKLVTEKTSILTAILDATPDLIFFKDSNLRHTECNKSLENHFNMRKSDIIGKNDAEAFGFPIDLVDHYAAKDKEVIAEKRIAIVEEIIPAADGKVQLFETIKSPIIDDGKVTGLVGISRDITHRKAAEESLSRQNSLLSAILDSASDPIFCIDLDSRYTECNKSFEIYFNVRKSDLIGKGNVEALGWSPDVTARHTARDKKVFAEKQALIAEEPIPSADGNVKLFETIKSPIIHDGEVTGLVGMARDITQRKEAEENLNRQNSLMSTVNAAAAVLLESDGSFNTIGQSMEMVCQSVDADRVFLWKNIIKDDGSLYYKQMYAWSRSEYAMNEDTPEYSYEIAMPAWKGLLFAGKSINGPLDTLPGYNPESFSIYAVQSILIVPLFLKGEYWGFVSFDDCHSRRFFPEADEHILRSWGLLVVGAIQRSNIMHDLKHAVSEAMEAYAEAEAANNAKTSFLASMSHEIRTPMNAILGITEIQLQNGELSTDMKNALNIIYNSGYTLLGIINDLLDLSKIEAGKLDLVNNQYEMASFINDTINLNMTRIGSKPIEFKLQVDENLPFELIGDEMRVKQILNNLLSNAFKYTDSGEVRLSFSAEITGEDLGAPCVTLTIIVQDTGQGMTGVQVQEMFDAYSRFNMKANRFVEGTGLGMNIVQNLVKKMDGDISVNSVPGKGTEVTVRLKQGYAGPIKLGSELAENLMNFRLTNMSKMKKAQITRDYMPYGRVLVVDDMETNLYVAKGFLLPYGLTIDTAFSGKDAIEKIDNGNVYDIVFIDHMMPVMDGIEAVKIIREKGYTRPIVALTANALSGQADMFMANGFDGFISKPIDIRELNTSLNKFVRDRQPPEVVKAARAANGGAIDSAAVQVNPELFKIFTRDAKKTIAVLQSCEERNSYEGDDLQMYIINVHALKSALANIGETKISGFASELEDAGREGNVAFIAERTSAFLSELRALVDKLKSGAEEYGDVSDEDKAYLHKMLLVVKEACAVYDKKAAKSALAELKQKPLPKKYGELLDTIAEHLLHSDFNEAETACDVYLSDKK